MYSQDLRERVVSFAQQHGVSEAKRVFGVNHQTIYNWKARLAACKTGPKGHRKLDVAKLNQFLTARNDHYQDELAELLGVSKSTISRAVARIRWSCKKNQGTS